MGLKRREFCRLEKSKSEIKQQQKLDMEKSKSNFIDFIHKI